MFAAVWSEQRCAKHSGNMNVGTDKYHEIRVDRHIFLWNFSSLFHATPKYARGKVTKIHHDKKKNKITIIIKDFAFTLFRFQFRFFFHKYFKCQIKWSQSQRKRNTRLSFNDDIYKSMCLFIGFTCKRENQSVYARASQLNQMKCSWINFKSQLHFY